MQTVKSFIPHLLVAAVSVFALHQTSLLKQEFENARGRITCNNLAAPASRDLAPAELIVIRDVIDGLARARSLDIDVVISGKIIEIKSRNVAVLQRYQDILSFSSALASLPWSMTVEKFCLGQECERGVTMKIKPFWQK